MILNTALIFIYQYNPLPNQNETLKNAGNIYDNVLITSTCKRTVFNIYVFVANNVPQIRATWNQSNSLLFSSKD